MSSGTTKHLLLLAKTWGWSDDGGLSSINKEIGVQFAKNEEVQVSCLVAHITEDLQAKAEKDDVHLFSAVCMKGFPTLDCLSFPPKSVVGVDVIIGYGKIIGRHAQPIKMKYDKSKWVHTVCSSFKDPNENEINFCENADLTFAIGNDVARGCERQLTFCGKMVHGFIPGIFEEFQLYKQSIKERSIFTVISFYPSASERAGGDDRYSIPTKAVGMLSDDKYQLISVCSPDDEPDGLKQILLKHEISPSQLKVRSHCKSLDTLCKMFVEVDLLLLPFLPSKSEDFGFIALQAISSDLPIRVSHNSGLGQALKEVPHGSSCVVDSDKPEDWAKCIVTVKEKTRKLRLSEASLLRESYDKMYPWEKQCNEVLDKILQLYERV